MTAEWFRNELDKHIGTVNDTQPLKLVPNGRIVINQVNYVFAHRNSTHWNEAKEFVGDCKNFLDEKDHACVFCGKF
ncbi:unnamed protein product [Gongylonema pulchrum]|uniref:HNH endonuclease n=1 Tax=Gongylonema pulchrum TaxID=637853 RepID=A0A183D5L2_9BILA|nr:unnamed protein product [Gongylonema pulchrum]